MRTPPLILLGLFVALLAGGCIGSKRSQDSIASDFVKLPANAKVFSVKEGEWGGEGEVVFSLPATPVQEGIKQIATLNPLAGERHVKSDGYRIVGNDGHLLEAELSYSKGDGTYHYEVNLEK